MENYLPEICGILVIIAIVISHIVYSKLNQIIKRASIEPGQIWEVKIFKENPFAKGIEVTILKIGKGWVKYKKNGDSSGYTYDKPISDFEKMFERCE